MALNIAVSDDRMYGCALCVQSTNCNYGTVYWDVRSQVVCFTTDLYGVCSDCIMIQT